jgi:hypothetical protein
MKSKNPLVLYFRSNLNITLLLISGILSALSLIIITGLIKFFITGIIVFLYLTVSVYFISTKRGIKEIIKENQEDRLKETEVTIQEYIEMRNTVSYLRINDKDIREAIEYFLLVSGNYLNKCRELKTYSPEANSRIQEVLKICQIYLEELDETVTEEKYGIRENEDFSDYKKRTTESIKKCCHIIKNSESTELTGLTRKEQMEIIEEMDEESK